MNQLRIAQRKNWKIFHETLPNARVQCKEHEINIIMGDLNAKVDRGRQDDTVGKCGLGRRNERGEKWIGW